MKVALRTGLSRLRSASLPVAAPAELPPAKGSRGPKIKDEAFAAVAAETLAGGRTLLGEDRLWILWQALVNVRRLGLPAAEVGSYRGGSAFFIGRALERLDSTVPVEVIDTFEGHRDADVTGADHPIHRPGHFGDTSFDDVRRYLALLPALTVRKGALAEVAPSLPHPEYGFVHLDVDLYEPIRLGLEYFAPRLRVGGVIVLDDYGARKCPGVREAAEEFLSNASGFQGWNPHTEQLVLVRTG